MILIPSGDPARFWQTSAYRGHEAAFELSPTCSSTATSASPSATRGESPVVVANPRLTASKSLKVARPLHNYNPDPEPAGWPRLAAILHNENSSTSRRTPSSSAKSSSSRGYKLAHLTATGKVTFKPEERAELKDTLRQAARSSSTPPPATPTPPPASNQNYAQIAGGQKPQPFP
jgi:hypothetical protein